ncbi:hypothetical protein C8Q74DRAFT_1211435 [Fomes fomentarius]|nr:hypothetical protein C8Q74DRAFT_1211435 [Fomes fomentarius]
MRYVAQSGTCNPYLDTKTNLRDSTKCCILYQIWLSLLFLSPILSPMLPLPLVRADAVNNTIDDTSPAIVYTPASSWHASSTLCPVCLAPDPSIAFNSTWHDGTHMVPTVDADDQPATHQAQLSGAQPSHLPGKEGGTKGPGGHGDSNLVHGDDGDEDGQSDDSDEGGTRGMRVRRRGALLASRLVRRQAPTPRSDPAASPFYTPHLDSDDEGFIDHPVSAQLNFTGSAVYVYALIPLGTAPANSTPRFMNLTFLLDSHPSGTYQHIGTASASGFLPSELVFGQAGLAEAPHSLTIQIGPDSVLLLDYIVYTQNDVSNPPVSSTNTKARNVATFAGAVGGSVGLLAILSLSLAISIYRRRLRAARRDRQYRRSQNRSYDFDGESFHTDASEDSPPMQGPVPFVPRYFPGTVVPAPPPPYSPPNDATLALLSSTSPVPWAPPRLPAPGEDTSYADRPPPTPPPMPEDGVDDYFAPPSFPAAISSPIPAILAGYSPVATSSAPVSTSPVPLHTNGSGSRGVYATGPPPSRSRANSDAQSQRSGYSDRPPSFASQAPPLIPLPQQNADTQGDGEAEGSPQRTSDADRSSVRSARSR